MIDIKTLHIGSHVEYDGRRAKILSLEPYSYCNCVVLSTDEFGISTKYVIHDGLKDLQPIPITPELLKELRFEERRREYPYGEPDIWYVDPESAQIEKENNLVVPTIVFLLGKSCYTDWWTIKVVAGNKPMRVSDCTIRYLHEAEAFLALHGVELIKE